MVHRNLSPLKKLIPLLLIGLFLLFPKFTHAAEEICDTGINNCCVPPQIIQDGGGCPVGTVWIGPENSGSCKTPVSCPTKRFNCSNNSCVNVSSGPACPSGTINLGGGNCANWLKVFQDITVNSIFKIWDTVSGTILGRAVYVPDADCNEGEVPTWDNTGKVWACTQPIIDTDVGCADGQVLSWDGDEWVCGDKNFTYFQDGVDAGEIYYDGGNVGIGTDNPAAMLDVAGGIRAGYNTDTDSHLGRAVIGHRGNGIDVATFSHIDHNNATDYALMQVGVGHTYLNTYPNGTIFFQEGASTKMVLSGGDVGIGDNSPDSDLKLDVEGKVGATEYCDENGDDCTAAADLGGSSGYWVGPDPVITYGADVGDSATAAVGIGIDQVGNAKLSIRDSAVGGQIFIGGSIDDAAGRNADSTIFLSESSGMTEYMSLKYNGYDDEFQIYGRNTVSPYIRGPHLSIHRDTGDATFGSDAIFNGNVGIGISDPDHHLEINTNMLVAHSQDPAGNEGIEMWTMGPDNGTSGYINFIEDDIFNYGFTVGYAGGTSNSYTIPVDTFGIVRHENSQVGQMALSIKRADGKVGINTGAPNSKLHVNSAAEEDPLRVQINGNTRFFIADTGGATIGTYEDTPPDRGLYIYGDVGIGDATPDAKLDVAGDVIVDGDMGIGTESPSANLHVEGDGTNNLFRARISGSTKFIVDDLGRVGIGMVAPSYNLDVNGNLRASSDASIGGDLSVSGVAYVASNAVVNGNVGIGDNTPDYKLDVVGDISMNNYLYKNDDVDNYFGFSPNGITFTMNGSWRAAIYDTITKFVGDIEVNDDIYLTDRIYHKDDEDTYIDLSENEIDFYIGGAATMELKDGDVGAVGNAVFKKSTCPTGYTKVTDIWGDSDAGFCIRNTRQGITDYEVAMQSCFEENAHICTYEEFYLSNKNLVYRNPNGSWFGNSQIGDDTLLCGNRDITVWNDADLANFDDDCARSGSHYYYCCISYF